MPQNERLLRRIFDGLLAAYGPQHWWPGDGNAFRVVAGAILTQNTTWRNVEHALANLEAAGALAPGVIIALPSYALAGLVRPSGYYVTKARKLQAFALMLEREFEGDLDRLFALPLDELRAKLLATYGIGPETADDIILYAAKRPSFVIDAYTRRVLTRIGLTPPADTYEAWRCLFMDALAADVALYNEYHALLDHHAKVTCRKVVPLCETCAILRLCAYAKLSLDPGGAHAQSDPRG